MTHPNRTDELKPSWRIAAYAVCAAIAGVTFQQAALSQQAEETNPTVRARQAAMKAVDTEAKAINAAITGPQPAADLAVHGKALAKATKDAAKAFEANVPGGGAKAEVWSDAAGFGKLMAALVANGEKVSQAAAAGNVDAVKAAIPELGCRTCHMTYRVRRAPPAAAPPPAPTS